MKFIGYLIVIIFSVVLQVALVPNLSIFGAIPNLVLIGFLILLFSALKTPALWWAGIGGILLDIFSPMHFGIYILLFLGIYFLVNFISSRFIGEFSISSIAIVFFTSSIIIDLIPFLFISNDWLIFLGSAVYNTILGIIIFYLVENKLQPKKEGYEYL